MPLIGLGVWEIAMIVGAIILLFGGKKLPQLGGAIGESIRNFKKGVKDSDEDKKLPGSDSDKGSSDPK